MVQPPPGPLGPVGQTHTSAGRAWQYMLHAFFIGWDRRMREIQWAKVAMQNKKGR